jgi:hypothetical protein
MPETPDPQYTQPNRDLPQDPHPHNSRKGIGFGLFLLLAGIVLLAERFGWLPTATDWFFPAILIAWGVGELYQRLSRP